MARLARRLDGAGLVDRLADDVHDAPERLVADRHGDRLAGVGHVLAAHEAFGGVHGDGAHGVLAEMLGDLEHEALAAGSCVSSAFRIAGRWPSNCTSTTAPITWRISTDYIGCHGLFLVLVPCRLRCPDAVML